MPWDMTPITQSTAITIPQGDRGQQIAGFPSNQVLSDEDQIY